MPSRASAPAPSTTCSSPSATPTSSKPPGGPLNGSGARPPGGASLVTSQGDSLFVRSEHRLVRVAFDDILIIEGLKDYVKLILRSRPRPLLTLMPMKSLAGWLPASRFMRVHRSYIVNLDAVEAAERGGVVVAGRAVPVSDAFRPALAAYLAAHTPRPEGAEM